uniref:Uncharacterized protein n=1 Tax=Trichogramma kaykai TaxID=54128 RepID=A0ABD2W6L0_9HYME
MDQHRDELGNTPLHLALEQENEEWIESLLRSGADPNLANAEGSTALRIICKRDSDDDFLETFFEIVDDVQQIDARDESGNAPLHLATESGNANSIESLLRKGADPNLANAEGSTALRIVCMDDDADDLAEMLFEISGEKNQPLRLDAEDNLERTPLQWAAASLNPSVIDLLLDYGADLESFVFPDRDYFGKGFDPRNEYSGNFKLILASGALAVVERLENRGYELDQSSRFDDHEILRRPRIVRKIDAPS